MKHFFLLIGSAPPCLSSWHRSQFEFCCWHEPAHSRRAEHVRSAQVHQTSTLLCYRERVIDLNAQISDGALDLCMAEQELDGPKVAGAPVDQRRLRPPEGVRAEKLSIKSDAGDSFRDKPRVLGCRHTNALLAAARE